MRPWQFGIAFLLIIMIGTPIVAVWAFVKSFRKK